jgi:hypothetical protein
MALGTLAYHADVDDMLRIDESLWSFFRDFIPRSSLMLKTYYLLVINDRQCVKVKTFHSLRFPSDITDPECIDDRRSKVR